MLLARRDAVVVFIAFAFAYFFSAVIRAITATLAPTFTQEFALSARELGLLAGGYFLGFAAIQLHLGRWLDRLGPKRVVLAFLAVAVAGCLAFSWASGFPGLLAARVLCGAGLGACLMAPMTAFRRWLTPHAQMRANAWMLMTGSSGMVASTLPVQWLVPLAGWRPLFWGLAGLLALAMAMIAWKVPAWPATAPETSPAADKGSYREVWRHPYFRRLLPLGLISYGGMIAMQTLWAGPWMVRVAGYSPAQAAAGLFTLNLCMLASFWTWGMVTPWLFARGWNTNRLIACGMPLGFVAMAFIILHGEQAGAWHWAAFCAASTFGALAQPAVGLAFPPALAGRALSAYNLVIFAGIFLVQWGIGLGIDAFRAVGWSEVPSFQGAMASYLLASVLAWTWFMARRHDNRPQ